MATFIIDNHTVSVDSARELVQYMHVNSFTQAADDKAYMLDVADRTVLQSGGKLRTDNPEAFVNDLVAAGLLVCITAKASTPPDQEA